MNQASFHVATRRVLPKIARLVQEYSICKFFMHDLYSFNLVLLFFYYNMTNIPRKIKLSAIIYYNLQL